MEILIAWMFVLSIEIPITLYIVNLTKDKK